MTSERKLKPDESRTWGYYTNLELGEEKDEIGEDWFTAGYIGSYHLNDDGSVNSLHALLNSFSNLIRESQERPFRLIIESAVTRVEPGGYDPNELLVKLEPELGNSTIDELREYADKLRIK
jgi:hypothetical protein